MANIWRSSRLTYRACDTADEAFFHNLSEDAEAWTNAAPFLPVPQGKEAAKSSVEWMKTCLLAVIICLPPDESALAAATESEPAKPKPIGHICLMQNAKFSHHRNAMIGFGIAREYQGKGYGTEAIQWVLKWGFRSGNLHKIEIGVFGWNPRALKLYEKLGFTHECRKREHLWYDGEYWDLIELGMIDREWKALYGQKSSDELDGSSK
ncbi:Hypothetical protein R9X50_00126300 [Acrodontium crateriforme]|uniref:N-acetyltransferase domain-containing protein n=1 Tax=Acrodontium crateriforme TaxID=150365 RepID=A0AAQ3LZG8_9PEZI|nr:Hypothetical protein R9X50_00126300 [Acrodontium crateriforme]